MEVSLDARQKIALFNRNWLNCGFIEHRDKLLVVTEEKRKKAEEIRTQLEMEATEKANEKWMKERFGE